MQFKDFYGPDIENRLYREDLRSTVKPEHIGHLSQLRRTDFIEALKYADDWSIVPNDQIEHLGNLNSAHQQLKRRCGDVTSRIMQLTPENIQSQMGAISGGMDEAMRYTIEVRHFDYLLVIHKLKVGYESASKFLDLCKEIDTKMIVLMNKIGESIEEVEDKSTTTKQELADFRKTFSDDLTARLNTQLSQFQTTIAEVNNMAKKGQETLEAAAIVAKNKQTEITKATEHVLKVAADQGVTFFAKAFNDEAQKADTRANWSLFGAGVVLVIMGLFFWFVYSTMNHGQVTSIPGQAVAQPLSNGENAYTLIQNMTLRISGFGFLGFLLVYFMRERRNFLHVAVANRHRSNLCSAYLAIADKRAEKERVEYLKEIMPHVSNLGKTGFISKEEVPDVPAVEALKAMVEMSRGNKTP